MRWGSFEETGQATKRLDRGCGPDLMSEAPARHDLGFD